MRAGAGGQSGGNEWTAQVSQGPGGKAAPGQGGHGPLGVLKPVACERNVCFLSTCRDSQVSIRM